ncbi:FAD binding domain-containingprotein [Penicillium cataractarum]|uniref:FAD binding domain-containingprotein n=1 Tax=Penicillium cataractarum TaxID=2100454 RepID=A0A9W9USC7_9EURO|nr:FAD binding domain-containingprotein [Penicillium cataractarum]KAJ5355557.1 FAD binding domain-containingprotein [Penicillium cataractarum]
MEPIDTFKIVIVGGGIAGLTLANMLEKFDLDYVLLESHGTIAPVVGASIGLFPNGLRILDQIDCYQAIEQIFEGGIPYNSQNTRDENGNFISSIEGFYTKLKKRHGYGLFFFDRQKLLEILYDNLRYKQNVLLNKRVARVNLVDGGVNVICADNSVFSGTIVVGADGIHSSVRAAMTELANQIEPGYFDPNELESIPCRYKCSFGIAQHVPGWVRGELYHITGKGRSQLVISGPDDKVYWFMFEQLPEIQYGKGIPKFSKEDEAEFVKCNSDVAITPRITFRQVYAKRLSSALTPLHEVAFKKWFFNRIITLGDSAHKPHPIGGQGGNGAIESCAELVNAISRTKARRGGNLGGLTDKDVETLFTETQSARRARADLIIKEGHDTQALFAYENLAVSSVVFKVLQPLFGGEAILDVLSSVIVGSSKIERLPVPHRPRVIPFHDELPEKPINTETHNRVRLAFLGAMGLIIFMGLKPLALPIPALELWSSSQVKLKWFGDCPINQSFNLLVGVLAVPIDSGGSSANFHLWNFIFQLISPLLIYAIEGYRAGHRATPLAVPIMYSIAMQVQGIGRIGPIYAALSAFFSHDTPLGQALPLQVVECLIPAITIGFVIPTVMALVPNPNTMAWHGWNGIWQFAPPLFNALLALTSSALRKWRVHRQPPFRTDLEQERDARLGERDFVPLLKTVYIYAFAVQATAHITSVTYAWHHPSINLAETFFALPNPLNRDWNLPSVGETMAAVLRYDMFLAVTAFFGSNIYSIWNLRRLGYIKTREALNAALAVLVGQVFVGSGATWAGLWYWREDKITAPRQTF